MDWVSVGSRPFFPTALLSVGQSVPSLTPVQSFSCMLCECMMRAWIHHALCCHSIRVESSGTHQRSAVQCSAARRPPADSLHSRTNQRPANNCHRGARDSLDYTPLEGGCRGGTNTRDRDETKRCSATPIPVDSQQRTNERVSSRAASRTSSQPHADPWPTHVEWWGERRERRGNE